MKLKAQGFFNILIGCAITVLPVYGFSDMDDANHINNHSLLKVTKIITFEDTSPSSEKSAILIDEAGDCFMYNIAEDIITHYCSETDESYADTLLSDFENCFDIQNPKSQKGVAMALVLPLGLGLAAGGVGLYEFVSAHRKAIAMPRSVVVHAGLAAGALLAALFVSEVIFTPDKISASVKRTCEQPPDHLHILPVPARFFSPLM